MFWKTAFRAMLILLLISALPSVFKIQPIQANVIKQNHTVAHPHAAFLPMSSRSNLSSSSPPTEYDEQIGFTFTQDFSSLTCNVTAVIQTDTYGYGPAYLLNGLTDSGYWYQGGLAYDWPFAMGGYTPGFVFAYEVFDARGISVFEGISLFGLVNPGDTVNLTLFFSSGRVYMSAEDWGTGALAYKAYSDEGAVRFVGLSSSESDKNGFFSGFMTEWWHVDPYYGDETKVIYTNYTSALTAAWMWIAEGSMNVLLFNSVESVNYTDPHQLQVFSSNGTAEISNAYELVTGNAINVFADGSVEGTTYLQTADNVTYFLTADINGSIVVERSNIIVDGNGHTLQGLEYGAGIYVSGRTNITLKSIRIEDFFYGIQLNSSSNNAIFGNNIVNNTFGIDIEFCSTNMVYGNSITANNGSGLLMNYSSNYNTIVGNDIANNYEGILLSSSSNNSIVGDNITANSYHGIFLDNSSDNRFWHDNFIDNTHQVHIDVSGRNVWDAGYPVGGNYWSDHSGVDLKSGPDQDQPGIDGIGDTPYAIDSNDTDHYPLMQPWTLRHDVAFVSVAVAKTVVGEGYSGDIVVLVANKGDYTETFNVTVYANATMIEALQGLDLNAGNLTSLTCRWNTTAFSRGNYNITAVAELVANEADTLDNNLTCSVPIHVGVPGDVSGAVPGVFDARVDMMDIAYLISLFQAKPTKTNWKPDADINSDGVVDMKDIAIAVQYFFQHE